MAKEQTLTECFAVYGAKAKNPRWSWSARSAKEVVITLWQDGISSTSWVYDSNPLATHRDAGSAASAERLGNLLWAKEHCGGKFRVVVAVAKNPDGDPRQIARCFPRTDIIMEITSVDEITGEFRAHRADIRRSGACVAI